MTLTAYFESLVVKDPATGCWNWIGPRANNGRPAFKVVGVWLVAARVAVELYRELIPKGKEACHSCDNDQCVNPDHIWLGTHAENMADASRKGRMHPGERHPCSKLKEAQVREIVALHATGNFTQAALGKMFGVSSGAVQSILSGQRWRHLKLVG